MNSRTPPNSSRVEEEGAAHPRRPHSAGYGGSVPVDQASGKISHNLNDGQQSDYKHELPIDASHLTDIRDRIGPRQMRVLRLCPVRKFQENACLVDVSFWQYVIFQKLNIWKLDCPALNLRARLECAPGARGKPILRVDARQGSGTIHGTFYHVNTINEFVNFPFSQKVADTVAPTLKFLDHHKRILRQVWKGEADPGPPLDETNLDRSAQRGHSTDRAQRSDGEEAANGTALEAEGGVPAPYYTMQETRPDQAKARGLYRQRSLSCSPQKAGLTFAPADRLSDRSSDLAASQPIPGNKEHYDTVTIQKSLVGQTPVNANPSVDVNQEAAENIDVAVAANNITLKCVDREAGAAGAIHSPRSHTPGAHIASLPSSSIPGSRSLSRSRSQSRSSSDSNSDSASSGRKSADGRDFRFSRKTSSNAKPVDWTSLMNSYLNAFFIVAHIDLKSYTVTYAVSCPALAPAPAPQPASEGPLARKLTAADVGLTNRTPSPSLAEGAPQASAASCPSAVEPPVEEPAQTSAVGLPPSLTSSLYSGLKSSPNSGLRPDFRDSEKNLPPKDGDARVAGSSSNSPHPTPPPVNRKKSRNAAKSVEATAEFSGSELVHISRHLKDRCCCQNGNDRLSTAGVCFIYRPFVRELSTAAAPTASAAATATAAGAGTGSSWKRKRTSSVDKGLAAKGGSRRERTEQMKDRICVPGRGPLEFMSLTRPEEWECARALIEGSGGVCYIATFDYSSSQYALSWSTRNLLLVLAFLMNMEGTTIHLLAFRDLLAAETKPTKSRIFNVQLSGGGGREGVNRRLLAGWLNHKLDDGEESELRKVTKMAGRLPLPATALFRLDLQSFLDNKIVQQNATELNVKLIKWRILPNFDPSRIQKLRVLLIGMGTLGCQIARDLVGWGFLKMTLLDCATVSPSNPARQSLYCARDVESGGRGRSKVSIAKERLLEVRGDLEIDTVHLEIPMPSQERFLIPAIDFLGLSCATGQTIRRAPEAGGQSFASAGSAGRTGRTKLRPPRTSRGPLTESESMTAGGTAGEAAKEGGGRHLAAIGSAREADFEPASDGNGDEKLSGGHRLSEAGFRGKGMPSGRSQPDFRSNRANLLEKDVADVERGRGGEGGDPQSQWAQQSHPPGARRSNGGANHRGDGSKGRGHNASGRGSQGSQGSQGGLEDLERMSYAAWMHNKLRHLIQSHDCVFLLTDSRESRWLPSLICQNLTYLQRDKNVRGRLKAPFNPPLCLTVALGFDTFVVIRHGTYSDGIMDKDRGLERRVRACQPPLRDGTAFSRVFRQVDHFGSRMSCYFCNDLTAPSGVESSNRTLDQQCTVTRAGVSNFASAVAIETLVALTQAPYGFGAMPSERCAEIQKILHPSPHTPSHTPSQAQTQGHGQGQMFDRELREEIDRTVVKDTNHMSCLGNAPHVTRGSVSSFALRSDWHPAFALCVCCSEAVQKRYTNEGAKFVEAICKDSTYLTTISGLDELQATGSAKGSIVSQSAADDCTDQDVICLADDEEEQPSDSPQASGSSSSPSQSPANKLTIVRESTTVEGLSSEDPASSQGVLTSQGVLASQTASLPNSNLSSISVTNLKPTARSERQC